MENEEMMLDENLDEDLTEDVEDIDDPDEAENERDDEFEYDEDGNIIIPEVVFDEDEDGDENNGDAEEEKKEDGNEEEPAESEEEEPKAEEPPKKEEPSEKDLKIARLEAELLKLKNQSRDTLAKLGVKGDDVIEGLASLAAEAEGTTTQEYLQKKANEERDAKARALLQQTEFEKIARADLAELHAAYPDTKQYKDVRELPSEILKKFGRFRDAGLSAKEAYAAANPDGIRNNVATAVKKQSLHESKSHLKTAVPKGSKDNSVSMPKSELKQWRDLFPGKSDKEIMALYKSTVN